MPDPADELDSLKALTLRVLRHRDERDWAQFHTLKELAISLNVEASELLALMQWRSSQELEARLAADPQRLSDELADVLHSLLLLSHRSGVDLGRALQQKLAKDALKYPVEKAKGRAVKYDEL